MLRLLHLLMFSAKPIEARIYPPGHRLKNDDGEVMVWPNHILISIRIRDRG